VLADCDLDRTVGRNRGSHLRRADAGRARYAPHRPPGRDDGCPPRLRPGLRGHFIALVSDERRGAYFGMLLMYPSWSLQYTELASIAMAVGFVSRAMTVALPPPAFGAFTIVPTVVMLAQ
jgi:hypothetical protein